MDPQTSNLESSVTALASGRSVALRQFLDQQRLSWSKVTVNIALVSKDERRAAFVIENISGTRPKLPNPEGKAEHEAVMISTLENENVVFWQLPRVGVSEGEGAWPSFSDKYDLVCVVSDDMGEEEMKVISNLEKNKVNHVIIRLDKDTIPKTKNNEEKKGTMTPDGNTKDKTIIPREDKQKETIKQKEDKQKETIKQKEDNEKETRKPNEDNQKETPKLKKGKQKETMKSNEHKETLAPNEDDKEETVKPIEDLHMNCVSISEDTTGVEQLLDIIAQKLCPESYECFLLSLNPSTKDRIMAKTRLLKERVWMTSLSASFEEMSGLRDCAIGSRDYLQGSRDMVFGSRETLFGSRDAVSGSRGSLYGSRGNVFGSRDNLLGSRDVGFGSRGNLFRSRDTFRSQDNIYGSCENLSRSADDPNILESLDTELLIQEVRFLAQQFGLDPDSINNLALERGCSSRDVYRCLQPWVQVLLGEIDPDSVSRLFRVLCPRPSPHASIQMGMNGAHRDPAMSGATRMSAAFGKVHAMLNKMIDLLAIEAQTLQQK